MADFHGAAGAPPVREAVEAGEQVRVSVRLFGALRGCTGVSDVSFDVPRGTPVGALRAHLREALRRADPAFRGDGLVDVSVLADESEIFEESRPLGLDGEPVSLAVLPPVCGG